MSVTNLISLLPNRKVATAIISAGVIYVAQHVFGLTLGSASVNQVVSVFVPLILAYLVKEAQSPELTPLLHEVTVEADTTLTSPITKLLVEAVEKQLAANPQLEADIAQALIKIVGNLPAATEKETPLS